MMLWRLCSTRVWHLEAKSMICQVALVDALEALEMITLVDALEALEVVHLVELLVALIHFGLVVENTFRP